MAKYINEHKLQENNAKDISRKTVIACAVYNASVNRMINENQDAQVKNLKTFMYAFGSFEEVFSLENMLMNSEREKGNIMLSNYQSKLANPEKDDSISSILKQLVRNKLFEKEDKANLVNECFIVKMDAFPKDGPIAKAIVYFLISKLNIIYEQLEKQAVSDDYVQIRHFTIIDEAHYMLDFDNRPLRNLIAVGRNKGLSIILATQNMASFQSKHFDFYANAQYPLIMKQQTISDSVIKDLFGVNGKELQEIRTEIAGLQKGELIIKDQMAFALDLGKKYKKIKVSHLI